MYIFFFSSVTLIHAFCLAVHWLPSASFCINHPLKLTHSVLIMFLHSFQCPTNISPLDLPLRFEEWNNWFQRGFFEGILFPHLTLLERFDFKIYVTFCSIYLHILEKYNFLMLLSQSKQIHMVIWTKIQIFAGTKTDKYWQLILVPHIIISTWCRLKEDFISAVCLHTSHKWFSFTSDWLSFTHGLNVVWFLLRRFMVCFSCRK